MSVNNFKLNISVFSGNTEASINLPINLQYQLVDQSELIQTKFVDVEVNKSINPIIDYEKIRFTPIDTKGNIIDRLVYKINFNVGSTYGDIGFTDDDIKFKKDYFTQTFINLNFYDSDNPMTQNLITNITLYSRLTKDDLLQFGTPNGYPGQPKPINQIPIMFIIENPLKYVKGVSEGFYLYDYKDELNIGGMKYLYMRASFNNAKDGKTTNMMVQNVPQPIDSLVHELYTRYILYRTNNGFFYQIDNTYQGNGGNNPNNVSYYINQQTNNVMINLYQINSL